MTRDEDSVPQEDATHDRHGEPPDLPRPPEIDRRVEFHPTQVAGLVMVALLPALSALGLFGVGRDVAVSEHDAVTVQVRHPTVQRFKVREPLRLYVTNAGPEVVDLELRLSRSYVMSFADVALTPAPDEIDAEAYVFEIAGLEPGEERAVAGEMQADRYWSVPGWATLRRVGPAADAPQEDEWRVEFSTFVWP